MSSIVCKCCDMPIEYEEGMSVVTCAYCQCQMPLPKKKNGSFEAAEVLYKNLDFDKAMQMYTEAIKENPNDSYLYWQKALCKYGIEYVEENGRYIPTIHRLQEEMFSGNSDYLLALQYADKQQMSLYVEKAAQIDKLEADFLRIKNNEQPFDVFICYKESDASGEQTPDSLKAIELYKELTRDGLKVFFAKYTLEGKIGEQYEPYIYAALHSAKVMILLGSNKEYVDATWVKNEWTRYLEIMRNDHNKKRYLIPACFNGMPVSDFPNEVASNQAVDLDKIGKQEELLHTTVNLCQMDKVKAQVSSPVQVQQPVQEQQQPISPSMAARVAQANSATKKRKVPLAPFIVVGVIALLLILEAILKYTDTIPRRKAIKLYENAQYEEAMIAFNGLDKKDQEFCATQMEDCRKALAEQKYNEAVALYEQGNLAEAYQSLKSQELSAEGSKLLKEIAYKLAKEAYDGGDMDNAMQLVEVAGDYEGAAELQLAINQDKIRKAEVGDHITFGRYEGAWASSEKYGQGLEWIVIDANEEGLMLLCTECVTEKDNALSDESNGALKFWSKRIVRTWLNNDFYLAAFNDAEREQIQLTSVPNNGNAMFNNAGAEANTDDYIFVLSNEEVKSLLRTEDLRICGSEWVTRDIYDQYGYCICTVDEKGLLNETAEGTNRSWMCGVRPAMWIYFEAPATEDTVITE